MSTNNNQLSIQQSKDAVDNLSEVVSMQSQLRNAIFDAVSETDVAEIVKRQVEKAKQGDQKSIDFVMKYALGFGQAINVKQVNVIDPETAARLSRERGQ